MPLFGTTILAVALPDRIVVATDSKMHDLNGKVSTGCKITEVHGTIAAVAGMLEEPNVGWRALDIATEVLGTPSSLDEYANRYLRVVQVHARPRFAAMRATAPELFARVPKDLFQVLFCVSRPVPYCGACVLRLRPLGEHDVDFDLLQSEISPATPGLWIGLGRFQNAKRLIGPDYFAEVATVHDRLRNLIDLEAKMNPEAVGGPVSIVEIGAFGVRWIDRGACREST